MLTLEYKTQIFTSEDTIKKIIDSLNKLGGITASLTKSGYTTRIIMICIIEDINPIEIFLLGVYVGQLESADIYK